MQVQKECVHIVVCPRMTLIRHLHMKLQKNHYEDMIKEHAGWNLVGIYADEGISGTSLLHRDEFNRMIADCQAGK